MAKRELQAFKKKYSILAELENVFLEIDSLQIYKDVGMFQRVISET